MGREPEPERKRGPGARMGAPGARWAAGAPGAAPGRGGGWRRGSGLSLPARRGVAGSWACEGGAAAPTPPPHTHTPSPGGSGSGAGPGAGRPGALRPHPPAGAAPGPAGSFVLPPASAAPLSPCGAPAARSRSRAARRCLPAGRAAGPQPWERTSPRHSTARAARSGACLGGGGGKKKGKKKILNEIRASSPAAMLSFRPERSASGSRKEDFLTTIPELHHPACQPLPGSTGNLSSPFPLLPQGRWGTLALGRLPATGSQRLSCGSWGTAIPPAPGTQMGPGWRGVTWGATDHPGRVPGSCSGPRLQGAAHTPPLCSPGPEPGFRPRGKASPFPQSTIYTTMPGQGLHSAIFPHLPSCFSVEVAFTPPVSLCCPGPGHSLPFPKGGRDSVFPQ